MASSDNNTTTVREEQDWSDQIVRTLPDYAGRLLVARTGPVVIRVSMLWWSLARVTAPGGQCSHLAHVSRVSSLGSEQHSRVFLTIRN